MRDKPLRPLSLRCLAALSAEDLSRSDFGKFLAYDRATLPDLRHLAAVWTPASGSRAAKLLNGLVTSAIIYDYYARAERDHDPALHYQNGTVREAMAQSAIHP